MSNEHNGSIPAEVRSSLPSVTDLFRAPDGGLWLLAGGDAQAAVNGVRPVSRLLPSGSMDPQFNSFPASLSARLARVIRDPAGNLASIALGKLMLSAVRFMFPVADAPPITLAP